MKREVNKQPKKLATEKKNRRIEVGQVVNKLMLISGVMLLTFSVIRLVYLLLWPQFFNKLVSFNLLGKSELSHSQVIVEPTQNKQVFYSPQRIIIHKLGIDVTVDDGGFLDDEWILFDSKASFLPTSGLPGEGFNTIIYAHNKPKLFGGLKKLKIGDEISLIDNKNKQFSYKVVSINQVDPELVRAIKSDLVNTLTLFTCDGALDEYRLVVQAELKM